MDADETKEEAMAEQEPQRFRCIGGELMGTRCTKITTGVASTLVKVPDDEGSDEAGLRNRPEQP